MNKINFSLDLMNSILQYLGNRPYIEVVQFIDQIKQEASAQNVSATNVVTSSAPTVADANASGSDNLTPAQQ